ncbi:MAG TPA: aromatic-ring-hydroxylating dioxygenase subunit beta [Rhodopila sp.]|nr:aromatic-ring-hydroxylating dioxygenase subunit beta [Rhodopila sp.]
MTALSAAETILRIAGLNAAYAAAIDDDRLEEWPAFFHEQCLYKITSADNMRDGNDAGIIYADSREMLADRVLALRKANVFERQSYRHIVGMPVAHAERDEILAETPFVVVRTMRDGRMDLFVAGRYRDRIIESGTRLQLRERVVICDSSRFDTLVAIPL